MERAPIVDQLNQKPLSTRFLCNAERNSTAVKSLMVAHIVLHQADVYVRTSVGDGALIRVPPRLSA